MSGKGKGGGAVLRFIVMLGLGFLVVGVYALVSSYFNAHSKQFAKGDYKDLNPLVEANQELPVGEFGKLSIRWVFGNFASEEESVSNFGISFSAGKSQYYLAVLDNRTVIAIQANDQDEIQRLERMCKAFAETDNAYSLSAQDFEGKIEKLTNTKLKGYYDDALLASGLKTDSSFTVKYLKLNTGAIPGQNILLYFVLPAAVVVIWIISRNRSKKKQQAAQAQQAAGSNDFSGM